MIVIDCYIAGIGLVGTMRVFVLLAVVLNKIKNWSFV